MSLRILIACERSGIVREAFNAYSGVRAFSCDLEPCEDGRSDYHIQGDALEVISRGWDLVIAHPPCRYLSVSGMHWNHRRPGRATETEKALDFVARIFAAKVYFKCVENPVSIISTRIRKPSQIIQPNWFGADASKKTCLWLDNLPVLLPTKRIKGRQVEWPRGSGRIVERWANQTDSSQNRLGPSPTREMDRARTYPGIAAAMAAQWIPHILNLS
jgi:hypothetical protein